MLRSEQAPRRWFPHRYHTKKMVVLFLEFHGPIKKVDPEIYVSFGPYDLLVKKAYERSEK